MAKGEGAGVIITGGTGSLNSWEGISVSLMHISQAVTRLPRKISILCGYPSSRIRMLMRYGTVRPIRCYLTSSSHGKFKFLLAIEGIIELIGLVIRVTRKCLLLRT